MYKRGDKLLVIIGGVTRVIHYMGPFCDRMFLYKFDYMLNGSICYVERTSSIIEYYDSISPSKKIKKVNF